MPAIYAHDRFGRDALSLLDGPVLELLTAQRAAFDTGLQGPDFLFYYRPYLPGNRLHKIGDRTHALTGQRFFSRCARLQQAQPDEVGRAYLCGFLCHYLLDSRLHPIINARCSLGDVIHSEAEMAFDRALLVQDGLDPFTTALGENLDTGETALLARDIRRFFSTLSAAQIEEGLRGMSGFQKFLLMPNMAKRTAVNALLCLLGPGRRNIAGHIMSREPIEALNGMVAELEAAYAAVLTKAPACIGALLAAIDGKAPLPAADFAPNFEGVTA